MITPAERAKIRELEEYLGWTQTPGRLRGFILRRIGTERVLTSEQAKRVIEGLTELAQEKEVPPEKGRGQG